MPVLCVMASADQHPHWGWGRRPFETPGVLLLENIDLWASPFPEDEERTGSRCRIFPAGHGRRSTPFAGGGQSRRPRHGDCPHGKKTFRTFSTICSSPSQPIPIDLPTMQARIDIWADIERNHPSVRGLDMVELVRLSANMARYDIYMAAQEALEEAYKSSLVRGVYVPVSRDNMFDKLAAYQPLESPEYRQLEEAVVQGFPRRS